MRASPVAGRANVPSIDIPRRRNTSKVVVLRPPGLGIRRLPVVLPARSFFHPEATALSLQDRYNYDWSGFRFAVNPRRFRGTGEWQAYILVRGHGVWRPARVHTPVPGPAERPRPRFGHGAEAGGSPWPLLGCFHPSQQNTFTGKLTPEMLDDVLARAREIAAGAGGGGRAG